MEEEKKVLSPEEYGKLTGQGILPGQTWEEWLAEMSYDQAYEALRALRKPSPRSRTGAMYYPDTAEVRAARRNKKIKQLEWSIAQWKPKLGRYPKGAAKRIAMYQAKLDILLKEGDEI